MKKITGISLFIFFCVVTAVLTAGLVFYQNNSGEKVSVKVDATSTINNLISAGTKILDMTEVAKHNTVSDCYMIINNKVYNLSDYASSHPGGSRNIINYCGKEATQAYDTKGSSRGSPHSSYADNLLTQYYIGDLNQKLK